MGLPSRGCQKGTGAPALGLERGRGHARALPAASSDRVREEKRSVTLWKRIRAPDRVSRAGQGTRAGLGPSGRGPGQERRCGKGRGAADLFPGTGGPTGPREGR